MKNILLLLLLMMGIQTAKAQADVTLCVDISCYSSITAPSVFGAFNGWNAGANQITDPDGDGIYCTTVNMTAGSQEFKFFFQEEGEETLNPTDHGACTVTSGPFTNRVITVVDGVNQTVSFGWESCDAVCSPPPTPNVTVCVDVSCYPSVTAPSVFGAFNGWNAGTNQVTDPDGDGIYCTGVTMAAGQQEFKFFFQEEGEETLTPGDHGACTITSGAFTNRVITVVDGVDQTVTYGWESCDAICSAPAAPNVTVCVDISCYPSVTAPSVFGAFNGWNAGANQVTDPDGDGIYCTGVIMPAGQQEFKFFFQEEGEETLTPGDHGACTITSGAFTNRVITVVDGVDQTVTYGWESCDAVCSAPPTPNVTLCVDISCHPSVTAPSVFGAFNGWNAGANQVTDPDGDGIYCTSVIMAAGAQEFKFFFQEEGEEVLNPDDHGDCTTTFMVYTNRIITVVNGVDQTVSFGWNSCDATCTPPSVPSDVEFCVDLTCYDAITNPSVFGTFNGWNTGANPVTDPDGDGIYCTTVTLDAGTYEYLYFFEEEGVEGLLLPEDAECTNGNAIYTNRVLEVLSDTPMNLLNGWNNCGEICETVPVPEVASPESFLPAEDVSVLFSNDYVEDIPVANWFAFSGPMVNYEELQVEGNDIKFYENLGYAGIETVTPVDLTDKNTFHIDFWTSNMTVFRIKLVDFGPDGEFGGGDDTESELEFTDFPQNTWVYLDIPLSDFTGLGSGAGIQNFKQLIISAEPWASASAYIDNVYFSQIHQPELLCRQPISTTNTPDACTAEDIIMLDPFVIDRSFVGGGVITNDAPTDFDIGTTVVTWTLTNDDGSISTCEQNVTVADADYPEIGPCTSLTAFCGLNSCSASVLVEPEITDNCGIVSVSGTGIFFYPVGIHIHPIVATDINGNQTVHNISIEVHDGNAPEFSNCAEEQVVLTSPAGGNIPFPSSLIPSASDNCSIADLYNDVPAAGLAVGENTVTYSAEDSYGNVSHCVINILVEGEQDEISLHPSSNIEASLAENEMTQIVSWNALDAATQCDYCQETNLDGFTYVGTFWGHQYFLATEVSLTRQDAQLLAESNDAHLAVISSYEENNFLRGALSNEVRTAWIGLMPQLENYEWSFVWDNDEVNEFNSLDLDMSEINEGTRIVLSQDGDWVAATDAEEKYFLMERPCVDFTQVSPFAPNSTVLLRSGDAWPEGQYDVTYAVVDMCGNESEVTFEVDVQPEVAEFCTTAGEDNSVWIEGVTFHELTNSSSSNEGYADFTEQNITMNIGDGVVLLDLIAGGNEAADVLYWTVWLDKNNDGDFFDADEVLFEQSTENAHLQANISLDLENIDAARLRVAVARHNFAAPCGNPSVGEIEDYTVTLRVTETAEILEEREAAVSIHPNPAVSYVNANLKDFAGEEVTIRIFDSVGKSMTFEQKVLASDSDTRIDLRGMSNGMYLVTFTAGKRMVTKRLVIGSTRSSLSASL